MAGERIERAAYSVNEMLETYGIGRTKLYEEVAKGRLVARKLGVRTLFLAEDIDAWIRTWPKCKRVSDGGSDGGIEETRKYKPLTTRHDFE